MLFWHHIPLGIDFRGGTQVQVKFTHPPNNALVSSELDRAGLPHAGIVHYGSAGDNEVLINLSLEETSEQALERGQR